MASTYLTKTMTAGNSNTLKFTFSAWVKRTGLSSNDGMQFLSVADEYIYLGFFSDSLRMEIHDVDNVRLRSNAKFRDTNAWYHVVFTFDSTQATASDRMKMWVNNEQITDLDVANYPNQNYGTYIGTNTQHSLGRRENDDSDYFDGIISHAHLTVGYTYTPSAFGEYDANGVWKIKTDVSVTYGNNGFFILKDGNSVTDQSGNSNNFTLGGGTLTKTEDSPSNVFCTLNALTGVGGDAGNKQVLSQGNLTVTGNQASWCHSRGTLGYSTGKWYWEAKVTGTISNMNIGVSNTGTNLTFGTAQSQAGNTTIYTDGSKNINGTITSGVFTAYSLGDIIGIAHNADANTVTFYKNGSAILSDQTVSGGSETTWTPASAVYNTTGFFSFNFGNGYFGTTPVASAGTNASGIGIFEHDVPNGYTALSTKGLNL